ncbi:putative Ntn-hydrolase superfamily protein [Evansella vedderi]|uniref:Ntn-hydrolase superfamily protein n=1 Tax=Evansella vedderi TaxID=38282 RepID=A0ABT9ZNP5_9BACI|nr:DUF1028 domain-containing protein [Evansella vedderi]MDQ0252814.1 putative Ntn-hydrolase superfamily protein [Evansella vedderi]
MKVTTTFSVAGRCDQTGALGAIVTSSSPAVGARCPWVKSGVGVVLSQNVTDPRLGEIGLSTLANGYDANAAIRTMVAASDFKEYRQLAVVDASGKSSVFTGEKALGVHGEYCDTNIACVGNLLSDSKIPEAMGQKFKENSSLSFPERLILSLEHGFALGGEMDDEHSIALLVYEKDVPFPVVDLRVDYSDDPLGDLKKVWEIYRPQAEDYKVRALNPARAPSYGVIGDK